MDADTNLRIKPALTEYLHGIDGCMGLVTNQSRLRTYLAGQLSDLQRKSIEPLADAAGQPHQTLQESLGSLRCDDLGVRDVLQRRVAERHGYPHRVGLIDETSFHNQGDQTARVMTFFHVHPASTSMKTRRIVHESKTGARARY